MSVREEDKQKTGCPSRGLGLAAAALSVGVGAALYYYFNKNSENPDSEGATTSGWMTENPIPLRNKGRLNRQKDQPFHERSWSLEECSICFDVMLRNQELMTLPCTHNFHTECILPWLQEKQNCPNCRKTA